MSEFRRVACAYHPEQSITNFCKETNCLMPLCPSCIRPHTEYHDKNGFKTNYTNISDCLAEVQTLAINSLAVLEQDKKRNEEVMIRIHGVADLVKEKVAVAKNMLYAKLETAFEDLQTQLLEELGRRQDEAGVFSMQRVEKHQCRLIQGISDLCEVVQSLKTERCLASAIKFYSEGQAQFAALHNQVSAALYVNENYTPCIEINEDLIKNLIGNVNKFVGVRFNFPSQVDVLRETIKQNTAAPPKKITATSVVVPLSPIRSMSTLHLNKSTKTSSTLTTAPPCHISSSRLPSNFPLQPRNKSPTPSLSPVPPSTSPRKYNYLADEYSQQFQNLNRKVRQIRRESTMVSKALKNF